MNADVFLAAEEVGLAVGNRQNGVDGLETGLLEGWPVVHDILGAGDNVIFGGAWLDSINEGVLFTAEEVSLFGANRHDSVDGLEAGLLEGWPGVHSLLGAGNDVVVGRAGDDLANTGVLITAEEVSFVAGRRKHRVDGLEADFLEGRPIRIDVLGPSDDVVVGSSGFDAADANVILFFEPVGLLRLVLDLEAGHSVASHDEVKLLVG